MRAAVPLLVLALLAGALPGCRDFHPGEVRPVDHTLLRADGQRPRGEAAISSRSLNPDLIWLADKSAPRTTLSFLAEEADSLPLIASWADLTVAEVLRTNGGFGNQPFGPGRSVTLELTPMAAARFNALRDVHLDKWRYRKDAGQEPVDVIEHVMAKDETLADLLERYPTTEDLLARENGDTSLSALREGRKVRVPVLQRVAHPVAPVPVEKAAKPVEKAAKPVEKAAKPVEKAAKPVEKAAKPVEKAAKPVARPAPARHR